MMFPWYNPIFYPKLPADYDLPPTVYSILNSYVNFGKEEPTAIKNLAEVGREVFFDFDYPLTENIKKEDFEKMILNNFLMRRIGFETMTTFKIALEIKLNEIMPNYNRLFDSLEGWDLFNDGEIIVTKSTSEISSNSSGRNDRRYSETPQGRLNDIENGSYMTDYTLDQNTGNSKSNGSNDESIIKSPADKMRLYQEFKNNRQGILTMIFNDLEELFYFIV